MIRMMCYNLCHVFCNAVNQCLFLGSVFLFTSIWLQSNQWQLVSLKKSPYLFQYINNRSRYACIEYLLNIYFMLILLGLLSVCLLRRTLDSILCRYCVDLIRVLSEWVDVVSGTGGDSITRCIQRATQHARSRTLQEREVMWQGRNSLQNKQADHWRLVLWWDIMLYWEISVVDWVKYRFCLLVVLWIQLLTDF